MHMELFQADDDYVRRLSDGDRQTVEHFHRYFLPLLQRKLRRRLNAAAVDDAVQEIFLRVFRAIRPGQRTVTHGTLGAFVNTIADHVMAEHRKTSSDPSMPRMVILWDPAVVTPEEYAELVTMIGDLARASGAAGITRVASEAFGDQSTGLVAT